MKPTLFALILLMLSACASTPQDRAKSVRLGDSRETVLGKMGEPDSVALKGGEEKLFYRDSGWNTFSKAYKISVTLKNGAVTEVTPLGKEVSAPPPQ